METEECVQNCLRLTTAICYPVMALSARGSGRGAGATRSGAGAVAARWSVACLQTAPANGTISVAAIRSNNDLSILLRLFKIGQCHTATLNILSSRISHKPKIASWKRYNNTNRFRVFSSVFKTKLYNKSKNLKMYSRQPYMCLSY